MILQQGFLNTKRCANRQAVQSCTTVQLRGTSKRPANRSIVPFCASNNGNNPSADQPAKSTNGAAESKAPKSAPTNNPKTPPNSDPIDLEYAPFQGVFDDDGEPPNPPKPKRKMEDIVKDIAPQQRSGLATSRPFQSGPNVGTVRQFGGGVKGGADDLVGKREWKAPQQGMDGAEGGAGGQFGGQENQGGLAGTGGRPAIPPEVQNQVLQMNMGMALTSGMPQMNPAPLDTQGAAPKAPPQGASPSQPQAPKQQTGGILSKRIVRGNQVQQDQEAQDQSMQGGFAVRKSEETDAAGQGPSSNPLQVDMGTVEKVSKSPAVLNGPAKQLNVGEEDQGEKQGEGNEPGKQAELMRVLMERDPDLSVKFSKIDELIKEEAQLVAEQEAVAEELKNKQLQELLQKELRQKEIDELGEQYQQKTKQAQQVTSENMVDTIRDEAERMQSAFTAAAGAFAGFFVIFPVQYLAHGEQVQEALPYSLVVALSACLMSLVYRYAVRRDISNTQIKAGVVTAFALTRSFALLEGFVGQAETGYKYYSQAFAGQIAASFGISFLVFGIVAGVIELLWSEKILYPFGTDVAEMAMDEIEMTGGKGIIPDMQADENVKIDPAEIAEDKIRDINDRLSK